MKSRLLLLGVYALLATSVIRANEAPSGVGPNGENGGLVAKFVDVDGIRTRYYDEGTGQVLVLVHGSGFSGLTSANLWVPAIAPLAKHFRVLAADNLAAGMTGNPKSDEDLNIRGEMHHIADFIRTLHLGPVNLVGQSRGGGIVFLLAAAYPELVKTLVIVDSDTAAPASGDVRSSRRARLEAGCPKGTPAERWPCLLRALCYNPAIITDDLLAASAYMDALPKARATAARMTPEVQRRAREVQAEMKFDVYRRIDLGTALQMPVLVYWSKNDLSAMPNSGEHLFDILAETNPRVRFQVINRSGHFPFREHPLEFAHDVTSFITFWQGEEADK